MQCLIISFLLSVFFFEASITLPIPSFFNFQVYADQTELTKKGEYKKGKKKFTSEKKATDQQQITLATGENEIRVIQTWNLPMELKEISGITLVSESVIGCVQDEKGIVYEYDLKVNRIINEYRFAHDGDFEGIAYAKGMYYVLRSDGVIFNFYPEEPEEAKIFSTSLNANHNCEGLFYDQKKDRLLLSVKNKDPRSRTEKGIYIFDLVTHSMDKEPAASIDLTHSKLNGLNNKKNVEMQFMPSDISINPETNEYYVINGSNPSLLIMDQHSNILKLLPISRFISPQPEGIINIKNGEFYISTEGGKGPGKILKCKLENN